MEKYGPLTPGRTLCAISRLLLAKIWHRGLNCLASSTLYEHPQVVVRILVNPHHQNLHERGQGDDLISKVLDVRWSSIFRMHINSPGSVAQAQETRGFLEITSQPAYIKAASLRPVRNTVSKNKVDDS